MAALTRPHTRPTTPTTFHHPAIHPDWLPPASDSRDGSLTARPIQRHDKAPASIGLPLAFNSANRPPTTPPAPGDDPRNAIAGLAPTTTPPIHAGLPLELNSRDCPHHSRDCSSRDCSDHPSRPCPDPPAAPTGSPASASSASSPYGAQPWVPGSALQPPEPDGPNAEDEDAIFRNPYIVGAGRETQLSHTALPLRHRIYALHCQGRTISAIARTLRLDRGTVARHLHAVEDLLLAEQTEDLARLRLRAVEAQHAILAATWDALLCEELNEFDHSNDHPYAARRAQLLATAARAARTAAHLQGLFTPAALTAALQAALAATQPAAQRDASAVADPAAATVGAHGCAPAAPSTTPPDPTGLPAEFNSADGSSTPPPTHPGDAVVPAATCGMPASALAVPAPPLEATGLPVAFNSTTCPLTTPAFTPTDRTPAIHGRDLGHPARTPAIHGRDRASGSPPRAGEGLGERSTHRPFIAAATAAVRRAMLQ